MVAIMSGVVAVTSIASGKWAVFSLVLGILFWWGWENVPDSLIAPLLAAFPAIAALSLTAQRTKEMNRTNEIALETNKNALKRNKIEDDRNVTDIFSRAVDQLGHDKQIVRRGGVAVLKQLSETAEKGDGTRERVINTLIAFVQDRVLMTRQRAEDGTIKLVGREESEKEKLDVADAIKALASITEGKEERSKVDLSSTDLRYINLSNTDLSYFQFSCANLSSARLREAILSHANFGGGDPQQGIEQKTDLSHADLTGADLSFAGLYCANLADAKT